ncbi:MAG: hypothetical protein ABI874_05365, partial [Chloroflexota bacterium]
MNARARAGLLIALVVAFLIGLSLDHARDVGASPSAQPTPVPPAVARKIEPALLKQLLADKNGLTPFIAQFTARADLSPRSGPNRVAQRTALVNALQATANRAQAAARAFLAARQTDGKADRIRPFWITNAIAGRADR